MSNVVDDFLNEATVSNVKVSKKQKIAAKGSVAAIRMAKEHNDPLYDKYKKYKKKMIETKKKLLSKYGRKGLRQAKKSMM